ncbi:conserved hypothetical protein [Leishmania infantum JPCM5]|uniref:Uncharacterized protein n=2 Tax=Leishmania infantum TaxID=5671 RepID=A4I1N0_LEIIN|nr:conserved hypothetical protein [Leishmania infantum JPCM5]CAC9494811.1 hypothetical_protein_-_conserved [Leishmania infantum]CAM68660.1 conserved hypothetical protein [Leishmania infantum JPCM5]SUZ42519.1 hypothetical_protein_-_conserved [Leishmania infantum]|eukprot:XP_001466221.1 conserved hypothetical protein [Leishmania infantum JPCM5]
MSKTLPSIQVHRPASVEQSHSYSRFSARGAGHEEHHRFYASSARVRSASPGATADSQFTGLSTLPRLPQVEFSLGPIQERVIPPYNDLEDPHLVPYWARKEMLIHERAVQRRRLRRQQEVEQQRRAAARRRFLQRRHQEREEMASRKGEQSRQREEERQSMIHNASKNSRLVPTKPLSERKSGAAAGGRSRQQAAAAASHRYYEAGSELHAVDVEERAAGGLPADHEYVTSSSSAATSRSTSSHSDDVSNHRSRRHDEGHYAEEDRAAVPAAPEAADEERTYLDEAGYPTEAAEKADAVKKAAPRSISSRSSSASSSSSSSDRQCSDHDRAAEAAREQAKAEARAEAQAEAQAHAGEKSEDSYGDDDFEHEVSPSRHQSSAAASSKSSAAAYFLSHKDVSDAQALPEQEEVHPLEETEQEAKEVYSDDEFEKSSASSDAAVDAAGAPVDPLPQQPPYTEEEENEPPAADKADEAAKPDAYEEDSSSPSNLSSSKVISHDAADADVPLAEEHEDQPEAYPEDAQWAGEALMTTEDAKPAEDEDKYSEDGFFKDSAADSAVAAEPQLYNRLDAAAHDDDAVKAKSDVADDAYDEDNFEDELPSKKSSVASSAPRSPAAGSRKSDASGADVPLAEEHEDQPEAYPEDAQWAGEALMTTEDAKPAEDEDKYSEDGFFKDSAADSAVAAEPQLYNRLDAAAHDDDAVKAKSDVADDAYDEDNFEDDLPSKKSSVASSAPRSPAAGSRKSDASKEDVEDEFEEELSPRKAADAEHKRRGSAMSSSAVVSLPMAQSAPSLPSSSISNSEVAPALASAVTPAAETLHRNSGAGMDAEELGSGANDAYADDFDDDM